MRRSDTTALSFRAWVLRLFRLRLLLPLAVLLAGLLLTAPSPTLGKGRAPIGVGASVNRTPTLSGAEPAYPLNHILEADPQPAGTLPANHDFETAGSATGTPPTNHNFSAAPAIVGTPPTNHDFASGDFTNWTTTGSPVIQSDPMQGSYAKLVISSTVTSAAFIMDSTAQVFLLDVFYISPTGNSGAKVYVLSGASYTTQNQIATLSCSGCARWETVTIPAAAFAGQSIKLKVERYLGDVGVDAPRMQNALPNWTADDEVTRQIDTANGNNVYAALDTGNLTSTAFTLTADVQTLKLKVRGLTTSADQYAVKVLSGPTYSTSTTIASGTAADTWTEIQGTATQFAGQSIKILLDNVSGNVGFDDVGTGWIEVPGWTFTENTRIQSGGPTGNYLRTNGVVTSPAFPISGGVQQLTFRHRGETAAASFKVELLRGASFSTVVTIDSTEAADQAMWKSRTFGVQEYTGEMVKLRISSIIGSFWLDTVGTGMTIMPAWTLTDTDPIEAGTDTNGAYLTAPVGQVILVSSVIDLGIIDRLSISDKRYISVSFAIGNNTGDRIQARWRNSSGQDWVIGSHASDSPTGYVTRYWWVAEFMGNRGQIEIALPPGGKLYAVGDNLARQALAEPFSQKVGLSVDTSTGAFGYGETDVSVASTLPFQFSRSYNAHSDRVSELGYSWSHSFDIKLYLIPVDTITHVGVTFGDGREAFFEWSIANQAYSAVDTRVKDTLLKNMDGTYTYRTTANLDYRFSSTGVLQSITDLNTNALTLAYSSGRLSTVTGPGGAALTLAYNGNGQMTSVTDPDSGVTTYAYDAAGDLVSVTNATGGTKTYTYNKHRLTRVQDEAGHTLFQNALDTYHRVTSQTDAAGKTITFAWDTPGKGATRVTDPESNQAAYYFDTHHRTTDKVDPLNRTQSFHFDTLGNLQRIVDPANNEWEFAWDNSGSLTQATNPLSINVQISYNVQHLPTTVRDGRGNVTTLMYNPNGNIIRKTEPAGGGVWEYTYDTRGNMLTEKNPLNQTTTYTYNAFNQRTSKTDPLNHTWTWTYSGLGHKRTETDPLNNTTTYTTDLFGRPLTVTDPLGRTTTTAYNTRGLVASETNALGEQTSYTYDNRGLLISRTDPAGKVWTSTYDDNRNKLTDTDPLGNTTTYGYDAENRLITVSNPLGGVRTTTYNTAGHVASEKDELNRVTSYTYDSAGRQTSVTLPNGATTTYTYDADGNLLTQTNAMGKATTYQYDALNRQTRFTDALGHQTNMAYDLAGRLVSETNALSQTTAWAYDAAGRRISETNALNQTKSAAYDALGRVLSNTDPIGRTTTYNYNSVGQLMSTTYPGGVVHSLQYNAAGRVSARTTPSGTATMTYDSRGLPLTYTNTLNQTIYTFEYDSAGRQVSRTDARGYKTTKVFDGVGQEIKVIDAHGGIVQFEYDATGQLKSVRNALGRTRTKTYDSLGNISTDADELGRTTTHTYDVLGRRTRTTDPRGVSIDVVYNSLNQPLQYLYSGGNITYAYDSLGRRASMTDDTGTTSWQYDSAARVTSVASSNGTVTYAYNAAGQRTSMVLPGNRAVSYSYDAASGYMTNLTDWANRATSFGYDNEGRRNTIIRPNGIVSTTTFDPAGRKASVVHTKAGTVLAAFGATYDAAGNRTGSSGLNGTETYVLDALGRLTSVTYADGSIVTYVYDAHGNRKTRTSGGMTTTYTYDDADQLLEESSSGTSTNYAYDLAGNRTSSTSPSGTRNYAWDWRGRLTTTSSNGITTSHTYDGDDLRVSTTTSGGSGASTSLALWDRESGLPLLIDDGSHGYVWADDALLGELESGSLMRNDSLQDSLGSVRGISDGNGSIIGQTHFDVYGSARAQTGVTAAGGFGWAGEQYMMESSLVYLRARHYDPLIGTFLGRDIIQPNAIGTQGYHAYAYTANNPTTWTDPSGHEVPAPRPTAPPVQYVLFPSSIAITAALARTAVIGLAGVSILAQLGLLEPCALDSICGPKLAVAANLFLALQNEYIRPFVKMFPIITFAVITIGSTVAIAAVSECVLSGRCRSKAKDCIEYEKSTEFLGGPYRHMVDRDNTRNRPVGPGLEFNRTQHNDIDQANMERSQAMGGSFAIHSDTTGERLLRAKDNGGVNPPAELLRSIDHICPQNPWNGSNSYRNACVMSAKENSDRGNPFPPPRGFCAFAAAPVN